MSEFQINKDPLFLKGLLLSEYGGADTSINNAKTSIYYYWWKFLSLSPTLMFAAATELIPKDEEIAKVYKTCGNLFQSSFYEWWESNCERLFAEPFGRKELKGIKFEELRTHEFDPGSIYVEVPLVIPLERTYESFRKIINQHHQGRKLKLAATSKAAWPLYTTKFRLDVIKKQYFSLLYRLLYPKLAVWRIGDRLQLAPNLKIRETTWTTNQINFNKLNSITGRYIYQGRYTLFNAERGAFPNSKKLLISDEFMPFGRRHHKDYLDLMDPIGKYYPEYTGWIKKNFEPDLIKEVYRKHRQFITQTPFSEDDERFLAFYSGETDLLP